ncbi:uncharacterized protein [Diadema setosum]|uniref:uncharacterized protein n=1 Tax=Diadema setosum TaxID=31175 RepID=UPI003B3AB0EA
MTYLLMLLGIFLYSVETRGFKNLSSLYIPNENYEEGATYLGCFEPFCLIADLNANLSEYNGSISPRSCVNSCKAYDLVYAAIRGDECNCSRMFNCSEQIPLDEGLCGQPCSGDIQTFCGGKQRISVYKGATYLGCFEPDCLIEEMNASLSEYNGSMILRSCVNSCRAHDLVYAAIRGDECNCSRKFNCSEQTRLDKSLCGQPCPGNVNMFCGGRPRISVYKVDMAECNGSCEDSNYTNDGGVFSSSLLYYVAGSVAGGSLIFAVSGCIMCACKMRRKSERCSAEGQSNADLDRDNRVQSPNEPSTTANGSVAVAVSASTSTPSASNYNKICRLSLPPSACIFSQGDYYEIGEATNDESPSLYHVLEEESDSDSKVGRFQSPKRLDRSRKGENGYIDCRVHRGTSERKTASLCLNAFSGEGSAALYSVVKK